MALLLLYPNVLCYSTSQHIVYVDDTSSFQIYRIISYHLQISYIVASNGIICVVDEQNSLDTRTGSKRVNKITMHGFRRQRLLGEARNVRNAFSIASAESTQGNIYCG
eukprot:334343_1